MRIDFWIKVSTILVFLIILWGCKASLQNQEVTAGPTVTKVQKPRDEKYKNLKPKDERSGTFSKSDNRGGTFSKNDPNAEIVDIPDNSQNVAVQQNTQAGVILKQSSDQIVNNAPLTKEVVSTINNENITLWAVVITICAFFILLQIVLQHHHTVGIKSMIKEMKPPGVP